MDNEKSNEIIDKICSIDYELWQYHATGFRYTLDYNGLKILLDKSISGCYLIIDGVEIKNDSKIESLYKRLSKYMGEKHNLSHERKEKMIYEKLFSDAQ